MDKLKIIIAMLLFGTIGLFVKYIDIPPIEIAFLRAFIASIFLTLIAFKSFKTNFHEIKKNKIFISISGLSMGFSWVCLFASLNYTSLTKAILAYYLAPIFIIIASRVLLKESLNLNKIFSIILGFFGLFLIFNNNQEVAKSTDNIGILWACAGAIFYAIVVILNKKIANITGLIKTNLQLISCAVLLIPLVFKNGTPYFINALKHEYIIIIILGITHTALAYWLYFGALEKVNSHSAALLSYIDPLSAIVFANLLSLYQTGKHELNINIIIGGSLILFSNLFIGLINKLNLNKLKKLIRLKA